jgi:hypothetical protein
LGRSHERQVPWVNDIRVNPRPNQNIAELQDITVERLAARWRYELFTTKKQQRAADRYYGLWKHARGYRTWMAAAPSGQEAQMLLYNPAGLTDFSRKSRRDNDTVAACGMLLEYMEQRDRKWLWREARVSMGRYANHVDNMVLHGAQPMWRNQDSWVDALRIGLSHLAAFFEAKRKLDYELQKLGETIEHVGNVDCGAGAEVVPGRLGANERQTEKAA